MQQAGLIQYAEKRSAVPHNRCSISEIKKIAANEAVPLKLKELAGVFVFFFSFGLFIELDYFSYRIILKKTKTKKCYLIIKYSFKKSCKLYAMAFRKQLLLAYE